MRDPLASTSPRTASNRAFNKPATPKRINRRALIAAIILGLVAAVLIVSFLRGGGASGDGPAAPTLQVVVATQDIAAGREITESMVELKALPETAVLGNPATAKEQVVGQVLRYPVALGEQLVNLRLLENVKIQILSFQIPQGLRAFTIPVNVNSTPAALMAPGDFVDLLASGPLEALTLGESATVGSQDSNGGSNGTVTLFQNIQVLAVQQEYVDNGVPYDPSVRGAAAQGARVGSVTLALTPEQVQHLQRVSTNGTITLSLRSFGDEEIRNLQAMVLLPVVVAARDIFPGQKITESMLELAAVPETSVIRNAAASPTQVGGQYLRIPVARGEQLSRVELLAGVDVVVATRDILPGQKITEWMVELAAVPETSVIRSAATSPAQVVGQYLRNEVILGEQLRLAELEAELQVVVAARDIAAGQKINQTMVELIGLPESAVDEDTATSMNQVLGQTLSSDVTRGALLSQEELVNSQILSFQIPVGMRGVTTPVSVTDTPVSLIAPGDYVDVLAALDILSLGMTSPGMTPPGMTPPTELEEEGLKGVITLFQNVQVLAVAREYLDTNAPYDATVRGALPEEGNYAYITLALTPDQAQLLLLGVAKDVQFTLTLRPYGDDEIIPLDPIAEPIQILPF